MGRHKLWIHFYDGFAFGIFWCYKRLSIALPFIMIELDFNRDATGWRIFKLSSDKAGEK